MRVQATAIRACKHSKVLGSRAWTSAAQGKAGEMMSTNHLVTIVSKMSTRSSKYGPGNVHSSPASCGAGAGRPLGFSETKAIIGMIFCRSGRRRWCINHTLSCRSCNSQTRAVSSQVAINRSSTFAPQFFSHLIRLPGRAPFTV